MTGLSNKSAVITGAAQGIGRAIAERFVNDGARVVVADIQGEKAEECARALEIHERELGPEHPETAWTRYNVALIAQGRGDLDTAREGFRQSLVALEAALGTAHTRTMLVRRSLVALDDPTSPAH